VEDFQLMRHRGRETRQFYQPEKTKGDREEDSRANGMGKGSFERGWTKEK
jgi:hypothetical protein